MLSILLTLILCNFILYSSGGFMKEFFTSISIAMLIVAVCSNLMATECSIPKLTVSGTAVLHKPADQVSLTMSIITQGDTAEQALSKNNEKMNDLVTNLLSSGIEKGEYFTGQFSIQPVYSPYPKNPPPEWKPSIIGYEVTNSLTVRTQKMEHAPTIIDLSGKAGVNQISNLTFGIKEPQMYRSEAISQAACNALQDANTLALAANIKIVRVLDIRLDQPQAHPRPSQNIYYMAKAENAPFIEAPDVDLSANVSVTFEIASK